MKSEKQMLDEIERLADERYKARLEGAFLDEHRWMGWQQALRWVLDIPNMTPASLASDIPSYRASKSREEASGW